LKLALKRQQITYKELARRLGLSESGVKKIFTAKDGSFQRVAEICAELGLSMEELFAGQEESMHEVSFSPAQQEYLADPRIFKLYWALVYERRSLADAQQVAGISAKESFPVLRRFDQLQLLELLPGGRLRVPAVRQVRWTGDGPLIRKLYQEWGGRFLRTVATPEQLPGQMFLIRYFKASRRTQNDLMAALRDIEKEFVRRATMEMRSEDPDLVHLRWMFAVDSRSYLE
jgi:transcriptional regulator with XRE-family HTH domain